MRSVHILSACNHGEVHTRHVCEVFLELLGAVTTHACWFQCQFPSTYKQKIEMWLTIKMYQHVGIRFSMLFLTFFDNDRFCSGWVWNSKIFFFKHAWSMATDHVIQVCDHLWRGKPARKHSSMAGEIHGFLYCNSCAWRNPWTCKKGKETLQKIVTYKMLLLCSKCK